MTQPPRTLIGALVTVISLAGAAWAKPAIPPVERDGYRIEWLSLTAVAALNIPKNEVSYSLNLQARLHIPADADVLGASYWVELDELTDEAGHDLTPKAPQHKPENLHKQLARMHHRFRGGQARQQHLRLQLSNLEKCPLTFRTFKGAALLLVARETTDHTFEQIEVGKPAEIAEGVRLRIERAGKENDDFRLDVTCESSNEDKPVRILSLEAFDEEGKVLKPRRSGTSTHVGGSFKSTTRLWYRPADVKVKKIKVRLVTETEYKRVPFEYEDLPLPSPFAIPEMAGDDAGDGDEGRAAG